MTLIVKIITENKKVGKIPTFYKFGRKTAILLR